MLVLVAIASVGCGEAWEDVPHESAFPLRGSHAELACEACHGALPEPLATTCEGCHEVDRPVPHDPGDCGDCHDEVAWGTVDHAFFPLTESHDLACIACHEEDGYGGLSAVCTSCHEADRPSGHFPGSGCSGCHRPTRWTDATVDHAFFPLQVAHDLDCEACHPTQDYSTLSPECGFCHEGERPEAHFEDAECDWCHVASRWEDETFSHETLPLSDGHALQCAECHDGSDYAGLSTACEACHEPDRPEEHFLGQDCADCHEAVDWEIATYPHEEFPLVDAHVLECVQCHAGPGYAGESSECASCHEVDRPEQHFTGEACEGCHGATTWPEATYDHSFFALAGAHDLSCADCHPGPGYAGETGACASCHEGERPVDHYPVEDCGTCHQATTWPDVSLDHSSFPLQDAHDLSCGSCHTSGSSTGLSTDCESCHADDRPVDHFVGYACTTACHQPTTWADATFDHAFFALQLAHDLPCASCHTGSDYSGLSPSCASCHEPDRPAGHFTTETECTPCHHPTTWQDVTWDHDPYFPLPHRDVSACVDCHLAYPDTSDFSCIDCHEHSEVNAGSHHVGVPDYTWVSSECLRCHPTPGNDTN